LGADEARVYLPAHMAQLKGNLCSGTVDGVGQVLQSRNKAILRDIQMIAAQLLPGIVHDHGRLRDDQARPSLCPPGEIIGQTPGGHAVFREIRPHGRHHDAVSEYDLPDLDF